MQILRMLHTQIAPGHTVVFIIYAVFGAFYYILYKRYPEAALALSCHRVSSRFGLKRHDFEWQLLLIFGSATMQEMICVLYDSVQVFEFNIEYVLDFSLCIVATYSRLELRCGGYLC